MTERLAEAPAPHGGDPLAEWRAAVARGGADPDALSFRTADGIALPPLLMPREGARPIPGARPAGTPWSVFKRIDQPDPGAANTQALADLEGGADGLALVPAGAPSADGFGLPVQQDALDRALAGVVVEAARLRVEPHPAAGRIAGMLRTLAETRKLDPASLDARLGLDPLSGLAASGGLPFPWDEATDRLSAGTRSLMASGFKGPFVEIDGRVFHAAGAPDALMLGAMLAAAAEYLRALDARGWAAEEAFARFGLTIAADQREFETIATIRAARLVFARLQETCGLPPRALPLHAETARRMMMAADPDTNIVRATVAAFAAAVGGADSIAVLPHTVAHGLPEARARRLARNTQLILFHEANLHRVADPAAGAGAIEALTDAIAERAWGAFREIEREGGLVASLEAGRLQARVTQAAAALKAAVASGQTIFVGATRWPNPRPMPVATLMPRAEAPAATGGIITPLQPIRLESAEVMP